MAGFVMLEAGGVIYLQVDLKNFLSQTLISDHIYQRILLGNEFNVINIQTVQATKQHPSSQYQKYYATYG
jgi:hypothetical protein